MEIILPWKSEGISHSLVLTLLLESLIPLRFLIIWGFCMFSSWDCEGASIFPVSSNFTMCLETWINFYPVGKAMGSPF